MSSYCNYRGFLINCHQKIYSPRKLRKVSAQALKKATSRAMIYNLAEAAMADMAERVSPAKVLKKTHN